MFNIMYIVHETAPGGATLSLLDMLTELRNFVNPVIVMPGHGILEDYFNVGHLKYYVVPFSNDICSMHSGSIEDADKNYVNNYLAAVAIKEIARKENIQLIHSNTSVNNVGAIAAVILGIPHVWHVREFCEEDFGWEFLDKRLKAELLNYADAVITISDCVREAYYKKYNINTRRIYNGLDITRYLVEIGKDVIREDFLLPGGISAGKGQLDAVKAAELLIHRGYPITLKLVGSGDSRYVWALKYFIRKKNLGKYIEIIPFQRNLAELRRRCGFAITASKMEALGRVTLEAMLAGNIVIGANTGGTLELIGRNQERGYLYHQGDYKDLARAMINAMDDVKKDQDKTDEVRKKAQKFVVQNCNTKYYVSQILHVYEDAFDAFKKKDKELVREFYIKITEHYEHLKNNHLIYDDPVIASDLAEMKMQQWMKIEQQGYLISEFFRANGIENVAIYGMARIGCWLCDKLEKEGIFVAYAIDRNPGFLSEVMEIYKPEDAFPEIDAVIVTVLRQEEDIKRFLRQKNSHFKIFGITQVLDWFEVV